MTFSADLGPVFSERPDADVTRRRSDGQGLLCCLVQKCSIERARETRGHMRSHVPGCPSPPQSQHPAVAALIACSGSYRRWARAATWLGSEGMSWVWRCGMFRMRRADCRSHHIQSCVCFAGLITQDKPCQLSHASKSPPPGCCPVQALFGQDAVPIRAFTWVHSADTAIPSRRLRRTCMLASNAAASP